VPAPAAAAAAGFWYFHYFCYTWSYCAKDHAKLKHKNHTAMYIQSLTVSVLEFSIWGRNCSTAEFPVRVWTEACLCECLSTWSVGRLVGWFVGWLVSDLLTWIFTVVARFVIAHNCAHIKMLLLLLRPVIIFLLIYWYILLTAVGLTPGGSYTLHLHTNNT